MPAEVREFLDRIWQLWEQPAHVASHDKQDRPTAYGVNVVDLRPNWGFALYVFQMWEFSDRHCKQFPERHSIA